MFLAVISTPENLAHLEAIRLNNLRLAGLEAGIPDVDHAKAIVWLGYSVHGNEAAGSEASMQVVYDLVTNVRDAHDWLGNTIVILEPSQNPDGYNRYTNWNNQVSSTPFDISTAAREHHEPWPGGRTNHYLFDLNRDWAWQTQLESRNRVRAYHEWMPQVTVDLHEMEYTSTYFFAPAAQPYHAYITEWQRAFQKTVAENNATYFDKEGWGYYTKEDFDIFYPSYGDTYPLYNGAVGMTYEQGGHSYAGRAITLPNGDTLSLADRIDHHTAASLSTIEVVSQNAGALVSEFQKYFEQSRNHPPGQYKAYVIKGSNSTGKLRDLCHLLDLNGIAYGKAGKSAQIKAAFDYQSGQEHSMTVDPGDLVVSAYQPRAILTQILFDPESKLVDSLTYDISCWSLPFAYGVQAYALKDQIAVTPGYAFMIPQQNVRTDAYAYVVRWESLQEGKFLAGALKGGMHPRVATEAFTVRGEHFGAGTIVFMRRDNQNTSGYPGRLISLAAQMNILLHPVLTGFVDSGRDLGSSAYRLIEAPHVLTLAGDGVSANGVGQVWYFFEQELQYPVTIADIEELGALDWNDFDILIMPEGYYKIPERTMQQIGDWVEGGGKLIAIGSALSQFSDQEGFALKHYAEPSESEEVKKAEERDRLQTRLESYASAERRELSTEIGGAVFRARVDTTNPLCFGLGDTYSSLKTSAARYELLVGADNAVFLGDDPVHYGFAGYQALESQKNTVIFAVEHHGAGTLIYMVDNPLFRAFWENGKFAFCNALFFSGE